MRFLTFRLVGPLQSWGDSARWDYRSTATMPSKSAVIGLLGCCLGYPRGDSRLESLSQRLHLAVRADRPGRLLWDFQTVQNPGGKILNAQGKPRGETIITPKQYLQNAAFQVFLFGDDEALEMCCEAMRHPKWTACLGRRSCPPAEPIVPRMVELASVDEAVRSFFDPRCKVPSEYMECQVEKAEGTSGDRVITRMDEVVRGDVNQYLGRSVYVSTVRGGDADCS